METAVLVQVKTKLQSGQTPDQKTFNRLKKKIERLQRDQKNRSEQLDYCLRFYHEKLRPEEVLLHSGLMERVKLTYAFYKTQNCFSREEHRALKELILDSMDEIFEIIEFNEVSSEIKQIFRELHGYEYGEIAAKEVEGLKSEMTEMFKERGLDVDFSKIDSSDSHEEIIRKVFASAGAAFSEKMENPQEKPKTKKQFEKEQRRRAIEDLQKRSMNTIYKQLAKTFHPDLEHDPLQKTSKETLMKRLTNAYESNDLYSLLALEMEWMNTSNNQTTTQGRDQLKIYNAILKDQVDALQDSIDILWMHPKYFHIQRFFCDSFEGMAILQKVYFTIKQDAIDLKMLVEGLQTPRAEKILKDAIRQRACESRDKGFFMQN